MSSASEINWKMPSYEPQMIEASFIEHCDSITPLSDEKINEFITKCHFHGGSTTIETMLHPSKVRRKTNLRDEVFLASLYSYDNRNKSLTELVAIGKSISLHISKDEAQEISHLTLPRLKSKCSIALRRGRITGSVFKNCCSSNIKDPAVTTVRRVIHLTKAFGDGLSVKCKKKIIDQYVRKIESSHTHCVFEECGLMINPELPYFSGTPDGLVSCNCHGKGCLKTKYLKSLSNESLGTMTKEPDKILIKNEHHYSLEKTHEFYYNVQLQINVIDLKYCDLVIWSQQKAIVVRVNADIEFWNVAMEKALTFHEQVIMPELLGKYFTERCVYIYM